MSEKLRDDAKGRCRSDANANAATRAETTRFFFRRGRPFRETKCPYVEKRSLSTFRRDASMDKKATSHVWAYLADEAVAVLGVGDDGGGGAAALGVGHDGGGTTLHGGDLRDERGDRGQSRIARMILSSEKESSAA